MRGIIKPNSYTKQIYKVPVKLDQAKQLLRVNQFAMYKMMISYNMLPGKEQECQDTLANKIAPGLARLGFRFADVWFTIYGNSPQILGGGVVKDLDEAKRIFLSDAWREMKTQLERVTHDLQVKLVVAREDISQE